MESTHWYTCKYNLTLSLKLALCLSFWSIYSADCFSTLKICIFEIFVYIDSSFITLLFSSSIYTSCYFTELLLSTVTSRVNTRHVIHFVASTSTYSYCRILLTSTFLHIVHTYVSMLDGFRIDSCHNVTDRRCVCMCKEKWLKNYRKRVCEFPTWIFCILWFGYLSKLHYVGVHYSANILFV